MSLSQRQIIDLAKDSVGAGLVAEFAARQVGPMIGMYPSGAYISIGSAIRGGAIIGTAYVSGMLVDYVNPMLPF